MFVERIISVNIKRIKVLKEFNIFSILNFSIYYVVDFLRSEKFNKGNLIFLK